MFTPPSGTYNFLMENAWGGGEERGRGRTGGAPLKVFLLGFFALSLSGWRTKGDSGCREIGQYVHIYFCIFINKNYLYDFIHFFNFHGTN